MFSGKGLLLGVNWGFQVPDGLDDLFGKEVAIPASKRGCQVKGNLLFDERRQQIRQRSNTGHLDIF
jgi:hypothetical protein